MQNLFLYIIGAMVLSSGGFYAWSKLLNKKINFKDYKFYICNLLLCLITVFNYIKMNPFIRIVFIIFIMSIMLKAVFKTSLKESIVTVFYTQLINTVGELLYSLILIIIFKFDTGSYSAIVTIFADIFITSFTIFLINFKLIKKLYKLIINATNKLKLKTVLIFLLPICFLLNMYLAITYYNYNLIYYIILSNLSLYFIMAIILILLKKENEYLKIYDKYNTTINSLKEYEEILDKYRISNHENKNQFLTIRNMLPKTNKKVISYIDEIIDNRIKDDEKVMYEVSKIPSGGLRGLIYSKILIMKEKSIKYELNISRDIRTVDLIDKLCDRDILDACKIIGVYLDNAIDATCELKNPLINITMYLQDYTLIFEISNNYKGVLEIEKIEQKGYTTKGSNRGYGLSLTREITNNNPKFENIKKLSKNIFTQKLIIKMQ